MVNKTFHANGKLLISGEYAVLDGAKALALPVRLGQKLEVLKSKENNSYLTWEAYLVSGKLWFSVILNRENLSIISTTDKEKAIQLQQILCSVKKQKSNSFDADFDIKIKTHLEFPTNYGLGSSSTLISLVAEWTNTNAYQLLEDTFGGSGYDLACAIQKLALFYSIKDKKPLVETVNFKPKFSENLFFIFLNEKQNSREGINHYRQKESSQEFLDYITHLTEEFIKAETIESFETLISEHEKAISTRIGIKPVKQLRFKDYPYAVKSLGAWGGDFVLVTTRNKNVAYFQEAGYKHIFPFYELAF